LLAIYLDPCYWNCGLGRRLHDEGMAVLHRDGYRRVTLWVLRTNARAQRFYEQAGWSLDGATKVDHIRGIALDEVRYVKLLGPAL
jgi:RimJ/RimL family protein N-acetyltransferase